VQFLFIVKGKNDNIITISSILHNTYTGICGVSPCIYTRTFNDCNYDVSITAGLSAYLKDSGLVLASGSKEAREARASSFVEVADSSSRAVSACFISISVEGVGSRRALLELARRSSVSSVAKASYMLHGIPRSRICARDLGSQVLLGPASSTIVTVVVADGSLTSNTIVAGKAVASTGSAVASSLVGALNPRVKVIGVDDLSNPGKILGASSLGAIGSGPLCFAVQTSVAFAVIVDLASAVVGARVLA